jgi:hypothetical protein
MSIHVKRKATILKPDQSRVLLRPFSPGDPLRVSRIISRILSLPENLVCPLLGEVSAEFSQRHRQIRKLFLERFEQGRELLLTDEELSEQKRLLIGSYFLAEYSLNPLHCSIPPSSRTLTKLTCHPALCVLSSACGRLARDTFPQSLFGPVSFTPTVG